MWCLCKKCFISICFCPMPLTFNCMMFRFPVLVRSGGGAGRGGDCGPGGD
jgi:hypothetical protein